LLVRLLLKKSSNDFLKTMLNL